MYRMNLENLVMLQSKEVLRKQQDEGMGKRHRGQPKELPKAKAGVM